MDPVVSEAQGLDSKAVAVSGPTGVNEPQKASWRKDDENGHVGKFALSCSEIVYLSEDWCVKIVMDFFFWNWDVQYKWIENPKLDLGVMYISS